MPSNPNARMRSFRAAWVIPGNQSPIRNGVVTVADDTITEVKAYDAACPPVNLVDLGHGAIIPGLVNAHTHLEFSDLKQPLGQPGIEFTQWVRQVVAVRANSTELKRKAIGQGLAESLAAGVCCIGEIATTPVNLNQYQSHGDGTTPCPINTVVYFEQLGRSPEQFAEKLTHTIGFLANPELPRVQKGLSPHAPYSVHPSLLQSLCDSARLANVPIAMHIAETREELELLDSQSGPFVSLLKDFGVWDSSSFLPPRSILELLQILSEAPRALIVHGNYLTDLEIAFIAENREHMSVVFCPRTHHYFQHRSYPLEKMLHAGLCVAIGTDSRASNPDLNLFNELKFLRINFPQISPLQVLKLGTRNGANALGYEHQFGSIETGKAAALNIVRPANARMADDDSFEWLFDDSTTCAPLK